MPRSTEKIYFQSFMISFILFDSNREWWKLTMERWSDGGGEGGPGDGGWLWCDCDISPMIENRNENERNVRMWFLGVRSSAVVQLYCTFLFICVLFLAKMSMPVYSNSIRVPLYLDFGYFPQVLLKVHNLDFKNCDRLASLCCAVVCVSNAYEVDWMLFIDKCWWSSFVKWMVTDAFLKISKDKRYWEKSRRIR